MYARTGLIIIQEKTNSGLPGIPSDVAKRVSPAKVQN
jgi:hypothetical protein